MSVYSDINTGIPFSSFCSLKCSLSSTISRDTNIKNMRNNSDLGRLISNYSKPTAYQFMIKQELLLEASEE